MRASTSSVLRTGAAALIGAVVLTTAPAAASAARDPSPVPTTPPSEASAAQAYQSVPCDPNGPTSADAALATQLNSRLQADMRGYMNAYRTSCARMVVNAVKARGLASRAAVIAVSTVIVETHLQNISVEVDHDSLGLFQQRASWGSREQRLNPTWATNAFLDKMLREYPNGSWMTAPIGEVCQNVQVSAYPDKYQKQAGDAQIIVNALWGTSSRSAPAMMRDDGDGTMTIWRWNSNGTSFTHGTDYESGPWT
ncbi:hypothetical protein ACFYSC_36855, partial [Streptosporangium sp. NPDC004379]|uniref:hypothetical protein n=1 Tax=Streptosporangium sp. NPDC004379 TaxID=3366189 RepID=UPI0036BB00CA